MYGNFRKYFIFIKAKGEPEVAPEVVKSDLHTLIAENTVKNDQKSQNSSKSNKKQLIFMYVLAQKVKKKNKFL